MTTCWIRHRVLSGCWCAIASISDHHAKTHCRGSVMVIDVYQFEVAAEPLECERCAACDRALAADELLATLRPAAGDEA